VAAKILESRLVHSDQSCSGLCGC